MGGGEAVDLARAIRADSERAGLKVGGAIMGGPRPPLRSNSSPVPWRGPDGLVRLEV